MRQEQKLLKQQEREQRRIFNEARKLEREAQEKQTSPNGSTSKHDTSRTKAGQHEQNKLGGMEKIYWTLSFNSNKLIRILFLKSERIFEIVPLYSFCRFNAGIFHVCASRKLLCQCQGQTWIVALFDLESILAATIQSRQWRSLCSHREQNVHFGEYFKLPPFYKDLSLY